MEKEKTISSALEKNFIKHLVDRFLGWKLPEDFSPDGGIRYIPIVNAGTEYEAKREPTGTNLFTAQQAEEMFKELIGDTLTQIHDQAFEEGEKVGYIKGMADYRNIVETALKFYSVKAPNESRAADFTLAQFTQMMEDKYRAFQVEVTPQDKEVQP